jgi:hypothetical protein
MTSRIAAVPAILALVAFCGCQPQQAEEDEIQKTLRMAEQAKRQAAGRTAGGNVYVSVERLRVSEREAQHLAALWKYTSARVRVSGGNRLSSGGVRLGLAGGDFAAGVSACARSAATLHRSSAEIAVLSGYRGYLWVGRSLLVPELRLVAGSGRAVVLRRARLGAALEVRPRFLPGGDIELELAPFFSELDSGSRHLVESMRTRVIVRPGQILVLGASSDSRRGSVSSALFNCGRAGGRSRTLITVRAGRP